MDRERPGCKRRCAICRENNGNGFELPEDDRDLLIHRAVFNYRGQTAPAWRDLLRSGFTGAIIERYAGTASRKSYLPASVMDSIGPEVEILTVMHQGPRAFDAIKGHVTRSYDGICSLRCISGDDFTLNTYFYVPDGHGWFTFTRGQVIFLIDFRSLRILGWALEPRKSYSSLIILSLCTHVFGEFGVPEVLYFERGLWKNWTLLKGKTDPFDFTEISQGLREFGIKFIHAIRPRKRPSSVLAACSRTSRRPSRAIADAMNGATRQNRCANKWPKSKRGKFIPRNTFTLWISGTAGSASLWTNTTPKSSKATSSPAFPRKGFRGAHGPGQPADAIQRRPALPART